MKFLRTREPLRFCPLNEMIETSAKLYGRNIALRKRTARGWTTYTYSQLLSRVKRVARDLRDTGHQKGNFIGIIGNWRSRRFGSAVLRGFRKNRDLPVESLFLPFDGRILPETRFSDHASFWDAGLPALMVTDTAFFRNPNYHLPSDTIDTLDFTFMAQLVKSLELAVFELPE